MEADWAAEIGPGLDWIEADWAGFIDLRFHPEAIDAVPEATANTVLRETLASMNASESLVFTSKCDVWLLTAEEIDPGEFDCSIGEGRTGMASWIDVIARDPDWFASFDRHEAWVRRSTERLRALPGVGCRADFVVRSAIWNGHDGFGITLYAAGCGADTQAAQLAWEAILRAAAAVTMEKAALPHPSPAGE